MKRTIGPYDRFEARFKIWVDKLPLKLREPIVTTFCVASLFVVFPGSLVVGLVGPLDLISIAPQISLPMTVICFVSGAAGFGASLHVFDSTGRNS